MLYTFLRLVRYPNLILIILTQVFIKYFLFEKFGIATTLTDLQFSLLCFATISIAAAGNIINDIYDVETDDINNPDKVIIGKRISVKTGFNLYIAFSIIGVGIGFYLSNVIGRPGFSAIFIIISALLYLYATYLKNIILAGNILVSCLVGMVILILGLYDLLPAITPQNRATQAVIFSILLDYALFAFLINWLREMVKDQEDVIGDFNTGRSSISIELGKERANKVIAAIALIPIFLIIYYMYEYLYENIYAVGYTLILIVGPLLYFFMKILSAKSNKEYAHLSNTLKLILVFGLFSIALYQFILL